MPNLTQCVKGGDANGRPGWLIKFEYDAEIVEAVKKSIPHTEREWYPFSRTWWVSEQYAPVMSRIFSNFDSLAYLQGNLF